MRASIGQWLAEFSAQTGEEILSVNVGRESFWGELNGWPDTPGAAVALRDLPLEILNHKFDDGYGAPGCPAVWAWSETRVFAISIYDGSTSWFSVPRNPSDDPPSMPGGG